MAPAGLFAHEGSRFRSQDLLGAFLRLLGPGEQSHGVIAAGIGFGMMPIFVAGSSMWSRSRSVVRA